MNHSLSSFKPRFALPLALALMCATLSAPAWAQAASAAVANACIFAGRLNAEGRWAPLASGITLLGAEGKPLALQGKAALESAKAVVLNKGALLAQCNGNQALPSGESGAGSKSPAPALSAARSPIPITAVAYAPIRSGGQWVELKLDIPQDRVILR